MITIRQMRYFDALASARHFGRAAQQVHISQPALSVQIMEMESHLGIKLIERTRSNAILTRKGEEVLAHVRIILEEMDRLERDARRSGEILDGLVRIGIIPTVAPYLVPQLVPHLRSAYPTVEIELREAMTSHLMADLSDGRLDAVIAALPLDIEGIETRFLFTDRFFMATAQDNARLLVSPMTEMEVDIDRLLLLEEGHCLRDQALAVCNAGKRSLVNFGATSMQTLLQMVAHDMGVTLIPEMAIPSETGRNAIRVIPFAEPQPSRRIGLAWRRSSQRDRDMDALAEAITAVSPTPVAA